MISQAVIPERLKAGDEVRILALSRSLGALIQPDLFTEADVDFARGQLEALDLKVSFGRHVMECNEHLTTSPAARIDDLNAALAAPEVKAILAVTGGMGAIQILDRIDYSAVSAHPKIFCGYSDLAYVWNAIYAKAGLVTYYGPNFGTLMMRRGGEYMLRNLQQCLFTSEPLLLLPADKWSDDAWHKDQENRTYRPNDGFWPIIEGQAEGTIVGGSGPCLNMMQGSDYVPRPAEAILFLESPGEGKASLMALDSTLRALSFLPQFENVRGIVLGRYPRSASVTREKLAALVGAINACTRFPVVANCDFGHTVPIMTIPIGGRCRICAKQGDTEITLLRH